MTHEEREKVREGIAEAGCALTWMRQAAKPKPLTEEDRARRAAVNAVAHKFGFPRPYPDADT
ncbi:MAG: hypothetical protein NW206_19395 [Hyphomonadaceae bacterium]|nr:hypothetical protein [Hyphomonadaceae bacterium]